MSPYVLRGATSEERSSLAKLIQPARKRLGMKQDELAKAAGISRTSIVNMESGKVTPQEDQLRKVLTVLGIPTEDQFNAEVRGQLAVIGGMLQAFPETERDTAVSLVIETLGARLRVVSVPALPDNVTRLPHTGGTLSAVDMMDDAGEVEYDGLMAADRGEHLVDREPAVDEEPEP